MEISEEKIRKNTNSEFSRKISVKPKQEIYLRPRKETGTNNKKHREQETHKITTIGIFYEKSIGSPLWKLTGAANFNGTHKLSQKTSQKKQQKTQKPLGKFGEGRGREKRDRGQGPL